jgi:cytochrome c oxidase subunit 3
MSTVTSPIFEKPLDWKLPYRGKVGMACLIIAESAIFTIFVVAYLFYLGKNTNGPTPHEVLETPIFFTVCLLFSSLTIHLAGKELENGHHITFLFLWSTTIALGVLFLIGTALEWHRLILKHGLTISTNLFGTTYYSLVGLHATHVTAGLVMLTVVLLFGLADRVGMDQSARIATLSMYWHFVDAVWIVVFAVVYVLGR